jgi:hypothetical protein
VIEKNKAAFRGRGKFMRLDLLHDRLPRMDIVFCRDCLVHLSLEEIDLAVKNIKRARPRFLIATTFPEFEANIDVTSPHWRPLNMQAAPFNFPAPIALIPDFGEAEAERLGKHLGVWSLESLYIDALPKS